MTPSVLSGTRRFWLPLFATITLIAALVPVSPYMPVAGLDPSWQMAMNSATATHLAIGKDLIFTFGPYAALFDHLYDPRIDRLMLVSGLVLALFFSAAFLTAASDQTAKFAGALFVVLIGWFQVGTDALFFSYYLILALVLYRSVPGKEQTQDVWRWALFCVPLGLLPLIKGNQLAMCVLIVPVYLASLLWQRRWASAALTLVVPLASCVVFWKASGQAVGNLATYVASSRLVLQGYTEAMGLEPLLLGRGKYFSPLQITLYLAGSACLLVALMRAKPKTSSQHFVLLAGFAIFLFVGFKSGFVRHDLHVVSAAAMFAIACLLAGMVQMRRATVLATIGGLVVLLALQLQGRSGMMEPLSPFLLRPDGQVHAPSKGIRVLAGVYGDALTGVWLRLQPFSLQRQYQAALASIRQSYILPQLSGGVDVYPSDQAVVLASSNRWDPRPVMQSYAAWTPALIEMNEAHLRKANSPQHILFEAAAIDNQLPSLEDGISWKAFLDFYTVVKQDSRFVYLQRRHGALPEAVPLRPVLSLWRETGQTVLLPQQDGPLFAKIVLRRTLFGNLLNTLYRPTEVHIELELQDGSKASYRVLPEMMETGFVVSPLVANMTDFSALMQGDEQALRSHRARAVTIVADRPGWHVWQRRYSLQLLSYEKAVAAGMPLTQPDSTAVKQ